MNVKKLLAIVLSISLIFSSTGICSAHGLTEEPSSTEIEEELIQPFSLDVDDGYVSGTSDFTKSWRLTKANGKYLNFYVLNNGTCDVQITINDKNARIIRAGSGGHITLELTDILNIGMKCTVKCISIVNGADIDIYYKVAQRDYPNAIS